MVENQHISVLLKSVLKTLGDISGKTIIDGTFGAGGYTNKFLESGARVVAFDRDFNAVKIAKEFKKKYGDRFYFISDKFSNLEHAKEYFDSYDAIVFDFGLSSMQIDNLDRGFSYQNNAPLDMRMNQNSDEKSASDFINETTEAELTKIIKLYGEDKKAHQIAKKIIEKRPVKTTGELSEIITSVSYDKKSLARVFQAIRIHINDELNEIETALNKTDDLLKSGGKLLTVSFHSGEDKIAKAYMKEKTETRGDARLPTPIGAEAKYKNLIRGTIDPDETELKENPRARSAHLRAIEKL